jgi:predicted Ser/Thr protein kinase
MSELEVTKLAASLGVGPQVVSYEPTTAIRKEYTFVPEDPLSEWEEVRER